LFVDPFKVEALQTISNGGYVSFEEHLNIDNSVTNCVKNIIERMINTDQLFLNLSFMPSFVSNELNITNSRLNIFQYSPNHHISFKIEDLPTDSEGRERNASTIPAPIAGMPGHFKYEIILNDDYVTNATDLAIARTIIHESIHAYISYIYIRQISSLICLCRIPVCWLVVDLTLEQLNII